MIWFTCQHSLKYLIYEFAKCISMQMILYCFTITNVRSMFLVRIVQIRNLHFDQTTFMFKLFSDSNLYFYLYDDFGGSFVL